MVVGEKEDGRGEGSYTASVSAPLASQGSLNSPEFATKRETGNFTNLDNRSLTHTLCPT